MKKNIFHFSLIILLGSGIALLTGFINTTPPFWVGATWYGFPMPWRYVLITETPIEHYDAFHLIINMIFWTLVLSVPFISFKLKTKFWKQI